MELELLAGTELNKDDLEEHTRGVIQKARAVLALCKAG
jgi:hypothetical protein